MPAAKPAATTVTFFNCILSLGAVIELEIFSECKKLQWSN